MKTSQAPERSRDKPVAKWERVSAASVGCCLGLALLKFGNPIVFFDRISLPTDALQVLFDPWPLLWAYFLFGAVFILAAIGLRRPFGTPAWILWLPVIWIAIQLATTFTSVDRPLSGRTFLHLATVAGAFYLGLAVIGRFPDQRLVWGPILTAFAIVLIDGLYQPFYGLEEPRRYFFAYEAPRYPNGPPPELLQKVASNRIYSTLFYPNTFAGTILLFTPLLLERISHVRATNAARRALLIMAAVLTGTCLIWSGSKAGWLIALGMAAFYVFRLPMTTRTR